MKNTNIDNGEWEREGEEERKAEDDTERQLKKQRNTGIRGKIGNEQQQAEIDRNSRKAERTDRRKEETD